MKKPTFIIGKKQIILSCLTLMLAVAVYINYVLAQDADLKNTKKTASTEGISKSNTHEKEAYGDTQFVNNDHASDDYFAQARLEKMTSRDAAVQTLQTIMGGGDITEDEMVSRALEAVQMSNMIEKEGTIENLIKAQGFADCVVYLDKDSAKIVVKSDGLEKGQAAAIKDIILGEVAIPSENIRIFEVK
ncbi:MAG: SpoIIIAH-like family protein [Clostridiales bacterium]|nr:SpoIIIAH-like family protein [Clostridiales bacterium]